MFGTKKTFQCFSASIFSFPEYNCKIQLEMKLPAQGLQPAWLNNVLDG